MSSLFGIGSNGAASFYNGVATTSVRFDNGSGPKLEKTPDASNRKTHTLSMWVKRGKLGANLSLFRASGSGDTGRTDIWFDSNDRIFVAGSSTYFRITNRKFRDVSSWYHLVFAMDTTDGTADNRLKIYVNGVQETSFSTNNAYSQNTDYGIGGNVAHKIGTGYDHFDGYIAEVNFIDGSQLTPSSFGETKNGVWIPIDTSGLTFGTEGYRLQMKQVGVGTASTSTIGADTSGNNNHYTSTGIVASDCAMPDSPENNFCTLNVNARGTTNVALSEGSLKFVCNTSNNFGNVLGTIPLFSGKWYCEGYMANTSLTQFGVQEVINTIYQSSGDFGANTDLGMWDSRGYFYDEGTAGGTVPSFANGDIINIAFDVDAGKIWFGKNGTYLFSGDPANGTNQSTGSTNDLSPIGVTIAGNGASGSGIFNCGQDDTFAGNKTSGSANATDSEGIGQFYYSPPSGFLAICSANLPEPTIGPNSVTQADDHFNTVIYNGSNGAQTITTGLQPDWIWIKVRSLTGYHNLTDTSRGITRELYSNTADAETNVGRVASTSSTGFTFPATEYGYTNENGQTFVSWNWKANGGTTSSNTDGDVTSTVQANTDAGFSIVTWTQGSGQTDVGHGLGAVPEMIIGKTRTPSSGSWGWHTFHKDLGVSKYLSLNANTAATTSSNIFNPVNSTVFGSSQFLFQASTPNVAYCFNSVEGYSKIGSYTGNGSADGTFVYTGFRPAWIMLKRTDSADDWIMVDTTRATINDAGQTLFANLSDAETDYSTQMDIVSNGFKLRNNGGSKNASSGSYIYMAFAEAPFKYANAR